MNFKPNEKSLWEVEEILNPHELYGFDVLGRFNDGTFSKKLWLTGDELLRLKELIGTNEIPAADKF